MPAQPAFQRAIAIAMTGASGAQYGAAPGLPANPGFYHRPKSAEDLVDHIVGRVPEHLGIEHGLGPRWGIDELV
jgi:3-polyprenyl-4-hydroxybenzoate decarboxylase